MPCGRQDAAVPAEAPDTMTTAHRTPFSNKMNENHRSCPCALPVVTVENTHPTCPHSTQSKCCC